MPQSRANGTAERATRLRVPAARRFETAYAHRMDEVRDAYVDFLLARARSSAKWLPVDFPSRGELAAADARRAAETEKGRPSWLKRVPDLHGEPAAEQDWSRHIG